MLSDGWPCVAMTAMNESTDAARLSVTRPVSVGGPYAGSVSRQYDTKRNNPYRLSFPVKPPL
jgi:hypothetical protein